MVESAPLHRPGETLLIQRRKSIGRAAENLISRRIFLNTGIRRSYLGKLGSCGTAQPTRNSKLHPWSAVQGES